MKDWFNRFYEKILIGDKDECWEWTACTNGVGYGIFYIESDKPECAHRVIREC